MKQLYSLEKVYSENFYYWQFNNEFSSAKVYFWFFEKKVTLEDFEVFHKRKGYGTNLFKYLLNYLYSHGIEQIHISSRLSEEAQSFWTQMTGKAFTPQNSNHVIETKHTLSHLNKF